MEQTVVAISPRKTDRLAGIALCAGVGGLEIGLHIAEPGYETVCYVERDAFAASVLVARMADQALCDAPLWDDVKSFDGRRWRGAVDILTAGYPCQPFSFSGHRRGEDDPRHLWPHVARIIGECEPEWVFAENVAGHVDLGLATVISDLERLGYGVEAGLFSAAEVGAAHWRTRLFILAHANRRQQRQPSGDRIFPDGNHLGGAARPVRIADRAEGDGEVVDDAPPAGANDRIATGSAALPLFAPAPFHLEAWHAALARRPDLQPCLYGLDHGVAYRMERPVSAGNGVVSLAAAHAFRTLKARHAG